MATLRYLIEQLNRAHQAGQEQDADHILTLVTEQVMSTPVFTVAPDTIVACAKCHDIDAPEYRLRRIMGRYALLCFKNGDGCWEHSPRPTCEFKDHEGVQCQFSAEVHVTYGTDETVSSDVCPLHVGAVMTPACGKITVYPLDI